MDEQPPVETPVQESEFNFWDKLKHLFSNPNLFFEKVKSEGMAPALLTYLVFTAVIQGVSFLFGFIISISGILTPLGSGFLGYTPMFVGAPLGGGFIMGIVGLILGFAMTFIYSGIIHLLVMAFKGQGSYVDTYKAYTYSMLPYLLFSILPLIGVVAIAYSFYLIIVGVAKLHNISKAKAALASLLPLLVVLTLLIMLVSLYLGMMFRTF